MLRLVLHLQAATLGGAVYESKAKRAQHEAAFGFLHPHSSCCVADASSKARDRCDDIKAQLDAVSDQIKQAEHAQHEADSKPATPDATSPSDPAQPHATKIDKSKRSSRSSSPVDPTGFDRSKRSSRSASPADPTDARDPAQNLTRRQPEGSQCHEHERAAGDHPKKKRKRAAVAPGDDEVQLREGSAERAMSDSQGRKRRYKAGAAGNNGASPEEGPAERAPGGRRGDKEEEEELRGKRKQGGQVKEGVVSKAPQAGDLPGLKKKRHLLYGQLQEARQEVSKRQVWSLGNERTGSC